MDYKKLMDKIEKMSFDEFQELRKTPEYRALNSEPTVKEEFMSVLAKRNSNDLKREKILKALYEKPEVLEWIKDIQAYRTLRIEQAWLSIAIREGENDDGNKSFWSSLDKRRRQVHNKALSAFCKLVESTSPFSRRDNVAPQDDSLFLVRDEGKGDLYDGPLMIHYEEANKYGNPVVRDAMTTGMFQLLKLIEQTARSDWDRARSRVLNRKTIDPTTKLIDVLDIQGELRRETKGFGMSEAPGEDDFGIDLFDDKDNRYSSTKRSGNPDDMEFD